ncbi:MAG: proline dehydrogenase family protein, partial [Microcystis panniformis]
MVIQIDSTQNYETKTQEIARQLLAETREKKGLWSALQDQMRWDDKLLDWAMSNPNLRVQLFRFIDCLPALRSNAEIANHLQQYLGDASVELPSALKSILNFSDPNSLPAQTAASVISKSVETLARKYIAGEDLGQITRTVTRLRKEKMAFTIDLLGEAVITEAETQVYLQSYLDLMTHLAQEATKWNKVSQIDEADGDLLPQVQVSVKLTAFYSQFDPIDPIGSKEKVCDRIRLLLRRAQ